MKARSDNTKIKRLERQLVKASPKVPKCVLLHPDDPNYKFKLSPRGRIQLRIQTIKNTG